MRFLAALDVSSIGFVPAIAAFQFFSIGRAKKALDAAKARARRDLSKPWFVRVANPVVVRASWSLVATVPSSSDRSIWGMPEGGMLEEVMDKYCSVLFLLKLLCNCSFEVTDSDDVIL